MPSLIKGSLRILNAIASSELPQRYGLEDRARQLLQRGAQMSVELLRRNEDSPGSQEQSTYFDLEPTEEQQALQQMLRRFSMQVLRPLAEEGDDALEAPEPAWVQAEDIGLHLMAVPENLGGNATTRQPMTAALVAESLAYGDLGLAAALLAPSAFIRALVDHGTSEQQEQWLRPFVDEEGFTGAVALLERKAGFDPRKIEANAETFAGGYRLWGTKALVPLGATADVFLVIARVDNKRPSAFIVERGRPGLSVRPEPTMGIRAANLATVELEDVRVLKSARLGDDGQYDHGKLVDRSRVAWAAMATGQSQAMLDYVKVYCNERQAFGEPISHRQSVAFMVANMAIEVEALRLLTWRAAARVERNLPIKRSAHMLRVQSAEKAMQIGTDGVQLLGGAGYVRDHPVERWYRHLRAIAVMEGGLSI